MDAIDPIPIMTQAPAPLPGHAAAGSPPPRLKVGVIGTGRAGSVLGAALNRAGHRVVAAYGVSDMSRVRAEALLPGVPLVTPQ